MLKIGTRAAFLSMQIASIFCFSPGVAHSAGCHFNTPYAIGCTSADAAVVAYERFHGDPAAVRSSNVRALLHQAQCVIPGDAYRSINLQLMNAGRVPTASQWVDVLYVDYNDGEYPLYFAKAYVTGNCPKFDPAACIGHMEGDHYVDTCPRQQ
ncbi:hypothetical protein AB4Y42_34595 [Paraburkholderia sp. EG286B]|uniref:hypothetical protein n=1 Tax=Paraburkholderia sp. EG286B TaxID=3237011 RepID=UPI0034D1F366